MAKSFVFLFLTIAIKLFIPRFLPIICCFFSFCQLLLVICFHSHISVASDRFVSLFQRSHNTVASDQTKFYGTSKIHLAVSMLRLYLEQTFSQSGCTSVWWCFCRLKSTKLVVFFTTIRVCTHSDFVVGYQCENDYAVIYYIFITIKYILTCLILVFGLPNICALKTF